MEQHITGICLDFERRIAFYEAEICRLKKENYHQRKLLDAVCQPGVRLHESDLQQLLVSEAEVPSVKQEWSPGLDQEEPEPPHIKEEEEELWSTQEEEELQGLEEKADIIKLSFPPVPVKNEDDEEKAQFPQLLQSQSEEKREAEPPASASTEQVKPELDGEDCGTSEPASHLVQDGDLQPPHDGHLICCENENKDRDDVWNKTRKPQSGLETKENNEIGNQRSAEIKPFSCSVCGKGFTRRGTMQTHIRIHTGEKPFVCSLCGKAFSHRGNMQSHMRIHTGQKPFSCSFCGKCFSERGSMQSHTRIHTGEKPFSCSVCGKAFSHSGNMHSHRRIHTGEKRFSCSVCGKGFSSRGHMKTHMRIHPGEKHCSCSVCGKVFSERGTMQSHMRIHTGEKHSAAQSVVKGFLMEDM